MALFAADISESSTQSQKAHRGYIIVNRYDVPPVL